MRLVIANSGESKWPQDRQPIEDYQSWDPLTQTKFIYEINKQAGSPVTSRSAYEAAILAVEGTIEIVPG